MSIPTVTVSTTNIKVSWTQPDDHGDTIDEYDIEFLTSDGVTFTTELTDCDGSDPAVVSALECMVDMLTLSTDLGLAVEDLVQVQIRAHNFNGWGEFS